MNKGKIYSMAGTADASSYPSTAIPQCLHLSHYTTDSSVFPRLSHFFLFRYSKPFSNRWTPGFFRSIFQETLLFVKISTWKETVVKDSEEVRHEYGGPCLTGMNPWPIMGAQSACRE